MTEPTTAVATSREVVGCEVTERNEWNRLARDLPRSHVLQSWEWGDFKSRHGWSPTRLRFDVAGSTAAAAILARRAAPLPLSILYVPKGPLLDYSDAAALDAVLGELERVAHARRAVFVKLDPDVAANNATAVDLLRRRGWRPSAEQIQFRNTLRTDLRPDPDDILMEMKSKTRYNIRYASRKGVSVEASDDLALFYELYAETAARDEFLIRPFAYYRDAWGSFTERGLAQLFIARYEDQPLAGVLPFRFGDTAWYMYGASRDLHRNLMPTYLLQWETMLWARDHGCTTYDWWGAPDELAESDPMWGVYRFKSGFAAEFVEQIGAWDYPTSDLLYRLYTTLMPRYLALRRRAHHADEGPQ
jgi:peptidoglycan pentaglycine glycine transferase (the first glycine)